MELYRYLSTLQNKRVTVLGMGVSNTPLIKLLLNAGCDITVRDRADMGAAAAEFERLGARLICGADYLRDLDGDVIFRTPGLHPDTPELRRAVQRGAVLTSEMEAFFSVCPCRIIGVTGSDGKTTTTSIIARLLREAGHTAYAGGNIGAPLLPDAPDMRPEDFAVIELSSFQLQTMTRSPDIAVITNLSPNHLDYHADMNEYLRAKTNIFAHQDNNGVLVVNYGNAYTRALFDIAPGEARFFSAGDPAGHGVYRSGDTIYARLGQDRSEHPVLSVPDILLPGAHNVENFMAAIAAAYDFISADNIARVAKEFKGVEHRIEFTREHRGVKYYNDSIASSPSRTIAGLNAFKQKVILIAGGKNKGIAYDALGPSVMEHVKKLIITGETAPLIRAAVEGSPGYAGAPEIAEAPGFDEAVRLAADIARPGDIVLMSPASTSFDRFKNFEERGRRFKDIVNGLE